MLIALLSLICICHWAMAFCVHLNKAYPLNYRNFFEISSTAAPVLNAIS